MQQFVKLIYLTLGLFIIDAGTVLADSSGGFNIRAGVGYDYISQEYFLESDSTYLNPDTSLQAALLKKDYLDDKKGFIYLNYASNQEKNQNFNQIYEIGWEQTDELFRFLGYGRVDKKWQKSRLGGNLRLEIKKNYHGEADPGEELTLLNSYLDYRFQLSNRMEFHSRIYSESVNFDTVETYIYNYSRYGIELGFSHFTKNFNSIFFNSAVEIRNVPDSGKLDYGLLRGNFGYFGNIGKAYITADCGLEWRNYEQVDNRDDYILLSLNSDTKLQLGKNYFLKARQNAEYFNFSQDDFINDDYFLGRFGLFVGRNFGQLSAFSAAAGPEMEILNMISEGTGGENYTEIMATIGLDYFGSSRPGGLFFMIENKIGKRFYQNDSEYISEFWFDRASLIGSSTIFKGLNFDILFSFDLEFHENKNDNSRLYLVSGGLSYKF